MQIMIKLLMQFIMVLFNKKRGFEILLQQVRTDNGASIRLHEALGFEKDNYTYTNRNGNEVFLYLKTIR